MELKHILEWVLPAVTVALSAFAIFWYRLFAALGWYTDWRSRYRRRRRRRRGRR